jgi:hypothetical protein
MPQAEIEHTVAVFERAKMVHALDRAATVIGRFGSYLTENKLRLYEKVQPLTGYKY